MPSARAFRHHGLPANTGRAAALSALAAVGALAVGLALPQPTYKAAAVVAVEGGAASIRPAMIQAGLDAAVSRSVISHAAAALAGTAPKDPAALHARDVEHLAVGLAHAVRADLGSIGGTLVIRAADADAARAATLATSVAVALVDDLNGRGSESRLDWADAQTLRLEKLRDAAAAAHRRLVALGGDIADPIVARAGAGARVEALRTRLDAIRSILASGTPPLGIGKDVPPAIDALQTSYLDMTRRLATARETLGERHTTVIGLQDGIRRATADLSAAWARLAKLTDADFFDARARLSMVDKGDGSADATRRASIDAARATAQIADDAVVRAQSVARDGEDAARYRLIARARVPALADGLAAPLRFVAATGSGLLILVLGLPFIRRRPRTPTGLSTDTVGQHIAEAVGQREEPVPRFFEDEVPVAAALEETVAPVERTKAVAPVRRSLTATSTASETARDLRVADNAELAAAMERVLPLVAGCAPRHEIPVVLLAANEVSIGTTEVALALAKSAVNAGHRVLIIEGKTARPVLAAAVAVEAVPALVDAFGALRIAMLADQGDGLLYIAPNLRNGARIAADLARAGDTLVADTLADEFDLVIIDGNRAADAVDMALNADVVLRVGLFASPQDDAHLLTTLAAHDCILIGTLAASVFVPRPPAPSKPIAVAGRPVPPRPVLRQTPRGDRRVATPIRRKAGLR